MFPKQNRIARKFFSVIFKRSKKIRIGDFLFSVQKDDRTKNDAPRFAVVVPQKKVKKAVARNALRRKMYAALASFFRENSETSFSKKRYICFLQPQDMQNFQFDSKIFLDSFKKVYKFPRK